MSIKSISFNGESLDIENILTKDSVYPVGSVYISVLSESEFNPNSYFQGTWEKIENAVLYGSGIHTVGETGGSETTTLSENELPSHNHDRGTYNITGQFACVINDFHANGNYTNGAFKGITVSTNDPNRREIGQTSTGTIYGFDFDASRQWTGISGTSGNGQPFSRMMPYLVCTIWKRVS